MALTKPSPRFSTSVQQPQSSAERGSSTKAVIIDQGTGTASKFFTIDVNGLQVQAKATIDAPFQVGDVCYVQKTSSGWQISGQG